MPYRSLSLLVVVREKRARADARRVASPPTCCIHEDVIFLKRRGPGGPA
jgi:hypothetical protein